MASQCTRVSQSNCLLDQTYIINMFNSAGLKCYVLAFFILLGGVIFFLYQWLVPGSMFRYWLCRRGSIPDHDLCFHYTDTDIKRVSYLNFGT